MAQIKDIYVYMDWQENDSPIQMGVLHSEVLRSKEVFSFENNTDWLTYKQFRALDPDLLPTCYHLAKSVTGYKQVSYPFRPSVSVISLSSGQDTLSGCFSCSVWR